MSLCIVYYCPSAGGNHLKNLINLDPAMKDNATLDPGMYLYENLTQGTVHSREGRNLNIEDMHVMIQEPDHRWVICAHFGELAPKRDLLMQIPDRKMIIIGIDSPEDRWLLEMRQGKLGQTCHPYWLHEEQPYLYEHKICAEYWRTPSTLEISLQQFWHPDLRYHQIIKIINEFLGSSIPEDLACDFHRRWWRSNFDQPEIRQFYGVDLAAQQNRAIITA